MVNGSIEGPSKNTNEHLVHSFDRLFPVAHLVILLGHTTVTSKGTYMVLFYGPRAPKKAAGCYENGYESPWYERASRGHTDNRQTAGGVHQHDRTTPPSLTHRSPSLSLITHSLIHSLTHSLTHTTHTHSISHYSLTHPLAHTTHSPDPHPDSHTTTPPGVCQSMQCMHACMHVCNVCMYV